MGKTFHRRRSDYDDYYEDVDQAAIIAEERRKRRLERQSKRYSATVENNDGEKEYDNE